MQSMDIKSGLLRKVATSPVRNGQFMTDADHRVTLVSGANAAGNVQVGDDSVRLEVTLPWLLHKFGEVVQQTIRGRARILLEKK